MLVLSRTRNESIIIGEGENKIEVVVTSINGNRVHLGIKAPDHVTILRRELYESIKRSKESR